MAKSRPNDNERARRTLYITGFNPKQTTGLLLFELFNQGGPVVDITLFESHAYVLFQHEESVPYCLALFSDMELHGNKLTISPRARTKETYRCINYLKQVRSKIRDEYMRMAPPDLPPKVYPSTNKHSGPSKSAHKQNISRNSRIKNKPRARNSTHHPKGRASNTTPRHALVQNSGKHMKQLGNKKRARRNNIG